jgi:hypothetical protein
LGDRGLVTLAGPVYFDTNRLIRDAFGRAGYPAPSHLHVVKQAEKR